MADVGESDAAAQLLDAVLTRRRQLLEMLVAERNRLGFAPKPLHRGIQAHIRWLERQLDDVTKEPAGLIEASPVWRVKDDLLRGRETHEGGADRVRAETADDPQRDGPTEHVLAGFISQTSIQLLTKRA